MYPEPPGGAAVCPLAGRCCKAGSRGAAGRPRCARVDRAERPSLAEQAVLPLSGYDFTDSERLDGAAPGARASGGLAPPPHPDDPHPWPCRRILMARCLAAQVDQAELERFDGAGPGKYTSGLGQRRMAFCGDQEDVVSIALTAVKRLLEKYAIDPRDVGRRARGNALP